MGNANNVNDMGFGGRGGFGRNRNGLNASKMGGANVNYEKKNVVKVDGSVRWNHSDGDVYSKNSSENFVSKSASFSNSLNQSYSRSNSWNGQARIEWTPDTITNILFRPTASYSTSDGLGNNNSASFNDDPYKYVVDPLTEEGLKTLDENGQLVNSRSNTSMSYSRSKSLGAELQYNRRLNSRGRNITLRADANYSDNDSKNLSTSNVHLYQIQNALGQDSTYQTNRYSLTPTKNYGYTLQATYS